MENRLAFKPHNTRRLRPQANRIVSPGIQTTKWRFLSSQVLLPRVRPIARSRAWRRQQIATTTAAIPTNDDQSIGQLLEAHNLTVISQPRAHDDPNKEPSPDSSLSHSIAEDLFSQFKRKALMAKSVNAGIVRVHKRISDYTEPSQKMKDRLAFRPPESREFARRSASRGGVHFIEDVLEEVLIDHKPVSTQAAGWRRERGPSSSQDQKCKTAYKRPFLLPDWTQQREPKGRYMRLLLRESQALEEMPIVKPIPAADFQDYVATVLRPGTRPRESRTAAQARRKFEKPKLSLVERLAAKATLQHNIPKAMNERKSCMNEQLASKLQEIRYLLNS